MSTEPAIRTRPILRGALHAIMLPISLVAGIILSLTAVGATATIACIIYTVTSILLFGTSGYYHVKNHPTATLETLRRADHANIYLIIAGTYTPLALIALNGTTSLTVMLVVWIGAAAGVTFRMIWLSAPRWLYTSLYIVLGWVAIFFTPQFINSIGIDAIILIAIGGLCYSLGAVFYALKRPNPWPKWFGFHEIFHSLTVIAWICQFSAIALVVASA